MFAPIALALMMAAPQAGEHLGWRVQKLSCDEAGSIDPLYADICKRGPPGSQLWLFRCNGIESGIAGPPEALVTAERSLHAVCSAKAH